MGINVKKIMYERIVAIVIYRAEMWGLNAREKKEINCNGNEIFDKYMWWY